VYVCACGVCVCVCVCVHVRDMAVGHRQKTFTSFAFNFPHFMTPFQIYLVYQNWTWVFIYINFNEVFEELCLALTGMSFFISHLAYVSCNVYKYAYTYMYSYLLRYIHVHVYEHIKICLHMCAEYRYALLSYIHKYGFIHVYIIYSHTHIFASGLLGMYGAVATKSKCDELSDN